MKLSLEMKLNEIEKNGLIANILNKKKIQISIDK